MEVRKFIKKTLQILAIVASCLFLLTLPASLVFVAIGSKVGTIVMLSLTLLSLVFVSVAANAASLEGERSEPNESSGKTNRRCEEVYNEDRVNDRRSKQEFKDS